MYVSQKKLMKYRKVKRRVSKVSQRHIWMMLREEGMRFPMRTCRSDVKNWLKREKNSLHSFPLKSQHIYLFLRKKTTKPPKFFWWAIAYCCCCSHIRTNIIFSLFLLIVHVTYIFSSRSYFTHSPFFAISSILSSLPFHPRSTRR